MGWYSGLEPILRRNEPLAATHDVPHRRARRVLHRAEVRGGSRRGLSGGAAFRPAGVHPRRRQQPARRRTTASPGIVVCMTGLADKSLSARGSCVQARAGTSLEKIVVWTARAGLSGLEGLAGIPGTVGGARADERRRALRRHRRPGRVRLVRGQERADLRAAGPRRAMGISLRPTCATRSSAWNSTSTRNRPKPSRSAAHRSSIKSAPRSRSTCAAPVVSSKTPPGSHAGQLIESAGLKGSRVGEACVSETHANFIVNLGGATAGDVLALSETVREEVSSEFGVELENEVCFWGLPQDGAMVERQLSKPALLPGLAHLPSGRGTTAVQKRKNRVSLVSAR